jgi:hypothetical protein
VRQNLGGDSVLERSDDAAAIRVVLGVGREEEEEIEGEADRKPRIWTSRSSRMLRRPTWIRGARSGSSLIVKMPRLRRRNDAEVNDLFVREVEFPVRGFQRIDVADDCPPS